MLSQAVQAEAAAFARSLGSTSASDDEGRSHASDVDKDEAKQRARCEHLAGKQEEAERRTSLAKDNLLNAIVERDSFVAHAGAVYLDLAKRERRATVAALLKIAAAEKAHCQARIRAAEALGEAARTAGQEERVEEEVGAWAARHKQPDMTHRYHAALRVLMEHFFHPVARNRTRALLYMGPHFGGVVWQVSLPHKPTKNGPLLPSPPVPREIPASGH